MIGPSICDLRACVHCLDIYSPDGTEEGERHACKAFPEGIPEEVLSGENDHTEPIEGDSGIRYEPSVKPIEWTEEQLAELDKLVKQDEEDEQSLDTEEGTEENAAADAGLTGGEGGMGQRGVPRDVRAGIGGVVGAGAQRSPDTRRKTPLINGQDPTRVRTALGD